MKSIFSVLFVFIIIVLLFVFLFCYPAKIEEKLTISTLIVSVLTLFFVIWNSYQHIPKIKCWVHDAKDEFTKDGVWSNLGVIGTRDPPDEYHYFRLFIENKSSVPATIKNIKLKSASTNDKFIYCGILILEVDRDGTKVRPSKSGRDETFNIGEAIPEYGPYKLLHLREYQPFVIGPNGYLNILVAVLEHLVNVDDRTTIKIEPSSFWIWGKSKIVYLQYEVGQQRK